MPDIYDDILSGKQATDGLDVTPLLNRMRGAERDQESSGGRNARPNPRTGALGDFQVLPENVPSWTRKHVGRTLTRQQFAADKDAQEKVFNGEMGGYLTKAMRLSGGDEDKAVRMASAAWYGGEGAMNRYDDPRRFKPNEPSFREYTTSVLNKSKKSQDIYAQILSGGTSKQNDVYDDILNGSRSAAIPSNATAHTPTVSPQPAGQVAPSNPTANLQFANPDDRQWFRDEQGNVVYVNAKPKKARPSQPLSGLPVATGTTTFADPNEVVTVGDAFRDDEAAPPPPGYAAEMQKYNQFDTVSNLAVEANRLGRVALAKQRRLQQQQAAQQRRQGQQGVTADDLQKYLGLDVTTFNGLSPENRRKAATTVVSWKTAGAMPTSSEQRNFRSSLGAGAPNITDIRERDNALIQQAMPTPTLADTSQAADRAASQNTQINKIITEETNRQGAGLKPFDERVRARLQTIGVQDEGTASPAEKVQILHRLKFTPEQIRGFGLNPSLAPPVVHTGGGEQVNTSVGQFFKEVIGQSGEDLGRGNRSMMSSVFGKTWEDIGNMSASLYSALGMNRASEMSKDFANVVNSNVIAWDNETQKQKVLSYAQRRFTGQSENVLGAGENMLETAPTQVAQIAKIMALSGLFKAVGYEASMPALFGIVSAVDHNNEPVKSQLQEFVLSLASGKYLEGLGKFGRVPSAVGFSLLGAGEAYARGERDPKKLTSDAVMGAVTGAALADPEGIKAREIPERAAGALVKMDALPEWAKDNLADVAKYGKGVVLSSDGRAVSVYADPNTGEVFGNALTPEQARQYDPSVVTGKARPVRDAKFIDSAEFDRLAQALNIEVPNAQPRLTSGVEPTVAEEKDITPVIAPQGAQTPPEPLEGSQAESVPPTTEQAVESQQRVSFDEYENGEPTGNQLSGTQVEMTPAWRKRLSDDGVNPDDYVAVRHDDGTINLVEAELIKKGDSPDVRQAEPDTSLARPVPSTEAGTSVKNVRNDASVPASLVSHPNPEIDGKPIVAETKDGRVIVPNPSNVSGVSVVRNRRGIQVPDLPKNQGQNGEAANVAPAKSESAAEGGAVVPESSDSYRSKSTGEVLAVRTADNNQVALGERGSDSKPSVTLPRAEFDKQFEKTEHKFSSTQVDLPKKETSEVRALSEKLIPDSELYTDPNDDSYGREDAPHITVKYGLHTEQADDVRKALAGVKPFTVKLDAVSIFPAKGDAPYDVVKVGVESPELHALNKTIADALKVTDTHPEYKPHVTLAYVKKGEGQKYVGDKSLKGKTLNFDKVTFSSSNGETVEIPLQGSAPLSKQERARQGKINRIANRKPRKRPSPDPTKHNLFQYVAFAGGVKPSTAVDLNALKGLKHGIVPIINKNGQDIEDLLRSAIEEGYLSGVAQGYTSAENYDRAGFTADDFVEAIAESARNGKGNQKYYSAQNEAINQIEEMMPLSSEEESLLEKDAKFMQSPDVKSAMERLEHELDDTGNTTEESKNELEILATAHGLEAEYAHEVIAGLTIQSAERWRIARRASRDDSAADAILPQSESGIFSQEEIDESEPSNDEGDDSWDFTDEPNLLMAQAEPRSPIRWVGGKRQFLPVIKKLYEPYRDKRLVEPFFGSGTVSFGLEPTKALVNDYNSTLANFHKRVAEGMEYDLPYKATPEDFKLARDRYNELIRSDKAETAEAAKLFYYLNQTAHGGLYRVNGKGEFNVPFQADKINKPIRPLLNYQDQYEGIEVQAGDFEKLKIKSNDFLYSDPPYDTPAIYQAGGFSWPDQIRHADWLSKQSVPVVTQNEATQRVLDLYQSKGFDVWKIPARRSISRDAGNRGVGSATEMIAFRNIPREQIEQSLEGTGATEYGGDASLKMAMAWHGSPHQFDKFSSEKIGTGEGNQTYGHGLYFTDSKEVAEWYRKKTFMDVEGRATARTDALGAHKVTLGNKLISEHPTLAEAEKARDEFNKAKHGGLYKVELAPKPDEYLLWDKPLSEQSENVLARLGDKYVKAAKLLKEYQVAGGSDYDSGWKKRTQELDAAFSGLGVRKSTNAADLYNDIAKEEGSEKKASEYLHSLGIRGIKYLDGSSRSEGEGSYNYVIFNDADVEISEVLSMANKEASRLRSIQNDTDLIPEIRSSVSDNTVIISPHAQELLRRAESETAASFDGQFLNPNQVRDTVKDLDTAAKEMRAKGYDEKDAKKLDKLKNDLIRAARSGKGTVVVAVENAPASAIPHESFHQGSHLGASEERLQNRHSPEHLDELANHPAAEAWRNHYAHLAQYKYAMRGVVVEETAATIAGGDYAKLGISDDVATDYLTRWFKSYVAKNGKQSVGEFRRQRDEVKTIIEEARDNYSAESGQPDESISGVQGERAEKSGGEPEKVSTGTEKERGVARSARESNLGNVSEASRWYHVKSNDTSQQKARDFIAQNGVSNSINALKASDVLDAEQSALAVELSEGLAKEASEAKPDQKEAYLDALTQVLDTLAVKGTSAGQFIQYLSRISRYSPEGAVAYAEKLSARNQQSLSQEERTEVFDKAVELQKFEKALAEIEELKKEVEAYKTKSADRVKIRSQARRDLLTRLEADEAGIVARLRPPSLKMARTNKPASDITNYTQDLTVRGRLPLDRIFTSDIFIMLDRAKRAGNTQDVNTLEKLQDERLSEDRKVAADQQQRFLAIEEIKSDMRGTGARAKFSPDGYVYLYHGTSADKANLIEKSGRLDGFTFLSHAEKSSAFGSSGASDYAKMRGGKGRVLRLKVDPRAVSFNTGSGEFEVENGLVRDGNVWAEPSGSSDALKMAQAENERDDLVDYATLQLLRNLSKGKYTPDGLRSELESITGNKLSDEEFERVASSAYAQIKRTSQPLSKEAKQSLENRREFEKLYKAQGNSIKSEIEVRTDDPLMREAAELYTDKNVKSRGDFARQMKARHPELKPNDLRRIEVEAYKIKSDAMRAVRLERLKTKLADGRDIPDVEMQSLVSDYTDQQRTAAKARYGLYSLLKRFEKAHDDSYLQLWKRFVNMQRGLIVSALQTTTNNMISQTTVTGIRALDDVFERTLVGAESKSATLKAITNKLFPNREGTMLEDTNWKDLTDPLARLAKRNKDIVDGLLMEHPQLYDELLSAYQSDIKRPSETRTHGVLSKVLGVGEKFTDIVTKPMQFQEFWTRRAVFLGTLQQRLGARGLNLDKLIESGETNKISEADMKVAVSAALEATFAVRAQTRAGTLLQDVAQVVPPTLNPLTFARFMSNGMKFIFEHNPTVVFKAFSKKGMSPRDFSKMLTGLALWGIVALMYQALHDDGDDWNIWNIPLVGKVDVRTQWPLNFYAFGVHVASQYHKGKPLPEAEEFLQAMTGINTKFLGFNPAYQMGKGIIAWKKAQDTDEAEKASTYFTRASKTAAGSILSPFSVPFKTVKDIYSLADKDEAIKRDVQADPFLGQVKQNVPIWSQSLPPRIKDGIVQREKNPALKEFGIKQVDESEMQSESLRLARRLSGDKFSDSGIEDTEKIRLVSNLKNRALMGEDVKAEVTKTVRDGRISIKSASNILAASNETPLVSLFGNLTDEGQAQVLQVARSDKRVKLEELKQLESLAKIKTAGSKDKELSDKRKTANFELKPQTAVTELRNIDGIYEAVEYYKSLNPQSQNNTQVVIALANKVKSRKQRGTLSPEEEQALNEIGFSAQGVRMMRKRPERPARMPQGVTRTP